MHTKEQSASLILKVYVKISRIPEYKHTYKLLYTQRHCQSRDFPLFYMELTNRQYMQTIPPGFAGGGLGGQKLAVTVSCGVV